MSRFARLTDKTTGQHRSVIYFGTGRDNEIITYHSMSDMYRRCHITVDATVCQTASTANMAIITDPYILDRPCVQNHHMITYTTYRRSMLVGIIIGNRLHAINQFRTVTIQCKYVCLVCRQFIIDQHFTSARFIEHCRFHPITKGA